MANIELVIKIPEEIYQHYKRIWQKRRGSIPESCIAFGTPLPKGHGRLIDADKLVPDCRIDSVYYDDDEHNVFTAIGITQIECADTIIEADKTESEEVCIQQKDKLNMPSI